MNTQGEDAAGHTIWDRQHVFRTAMELAAAIPGESADTVLNQSPSCSTLTNVLQREARSPGGETLPPSRLRQNAQAHTTPTTIPVTPTTVPHHVVTVITCEAQYKSQ